MPPETGTALLILLIFALPGFVTLLVKERTHEIPRPVTSFERLLSTLYYSLLVYAPLAVLAVLAGWRLSDLEALYRGEKGLGAMVVVGLMSGLLIPSVVAYAGHRWLDSPLRTRVLGFLGVSTAHRTRTAWDRAFSGSRRALVRATLRDSAVVGGYYGFDSFAAYGERGGDLYLEKQWNIDPETLALTGPSGNTVGLWLSGSDVVRIELYAVEDADAKEQGD